MPEIDAHLEEIEDRELLDVDGGQAIDGLAGFNVPDPLQDRKRPPTCRTTGIGCAWP